MNVPWIAAAAVSPQMKELLSRMYALIVNENQRTQLETTVEPRSSRAELEQASHVTEDQQPARS
jgi:hypothetical protein